MDKLGHFLLLLILLCLLSFSVTAEMQTVQPVPRTDSTSFQVPVLISRLPNYTVNTQPVQVKIVSNNKAGLFDWLVGIIVPLFSASLGGWITWRGVKHTISDAAQKEKLSIKPWLYSYFVSQDTPPSSRVFYFDPPAPLPEKSVYYNFNIKNTDNGICFIQKIIVNDIEYHLKNANNIVLGKNETIALSLFLNSTKYCNGDYNRIFLYVKDVNGNQYRYPLLIDLSLHPTDYNGRTIGLCEDLNDK